MFNFRSPSFKKLGLDRENMGDQEMVDLMMKEPRLIRRPVVEIGRKVHFGADRKTLEDLLDA